MEYKTANAYYFRSILAIGGIESHLYYIAQKYGKWDVTVFYQTADPAQLARLRKYVRCVALTPADHITCDNLFCCFNREVLDQCTAKHKYLVLHGDYLDMVNRGQLSMTNLPRDDRIDKYLGVSQHVCDTWEQVTGIHAEFIGEPVIVPEERPLRLLSATRLSAEKGWTRMQILAQALEKAGISYTWDIYTNSPRERVTPNIYFHDPRLDISAIMHSFDAYVQLSDNEGFCLSVVEALMQGVPVIGTDLPVFHELGLTDENSILLPLDMKQIPIDRIKNITGLKFKYQPPEERWAKYLSHKKSTYKNKTYKVRATKVWSLLRILDVESGTIHPEGEIFTVTEERFGQLRDFEKRIDAKLMEEI